MASAKKISVKAMPSNGSEVVFDEPVSFLWRNYRIVLREIGAQQASGTPTVSNPRRSFHYHREEKSFQLQLEQHKNRAAEGRHRFWF